MSVNKMKKFVGRNVEFIGKTYDFDSHDIVRVPMVGTIVGPSVYGKNWVDIRVDDDGYWHTPQIHSAPFGTVTIL